MAEWVERKISDIGTVVGGATPSTKKPENYKDGKIAWITPKDLSTFSSRYIERGERNITEIGLKSCSTQLLPPNTVLFSSRAPIGYVAIATNGVCTNQGFKRIQTLSSCSIYSNTTRIKLKKWVAVRLSKKYPETQ